LNDAGEWYALHSINLLTALDPGKVEHVIDEPRETFAFVDHGLEILGPRPFIRGPSHRESLSEHPDRRQRCFELVRDTRDKMRSHSSDFNFAAHIAKQQIPDKHCDTEDQSDSGHIQ